MSQSKETVFRNGYDGQQIYWGPEEEQEKKLRSTRTWLTLKHISLPSKILIRLFDVRSFQLGTMGTEGCVRPTPILIDLSLVELGLESRYTRPNTMLFSMRNLDFQKIKVQLSLLLALTSFSQSKVLCPQGWAYPVPDLVPSDHGAGEQRTVGLDADQGVHSTHPSMRPHFSYL